MAISLLTDSERRAFEALGESTKTKFAAVLQKSRLTEIPDEVRELRKQIDEIKQSSKKNGNMLKSIMSIFKFAGKEADRHRD